MGSKDGEPPLYTAHLDLGTEICTDIDLGLSAWYSSHTHTPTLTLTGSRKREFDTARETR